jgi:heme/copper-type cytochrome/quinol oxidase subunit 2
MPCVTFALHIGAYTGDDATDVGDICDDNDAMKITMTIVMMMVATVVMVIMLTIVSMSKLIRAEQHQQKANANANANALQVVLWMMQVPVYLSTLTYIIMHLHCMQK